MSETDLVKVEIMPVTACGIKEVIFKRFLVEV
jgi:hypothetical protein